MEVAKDKIAELKSEDDSPDENGHRFVFINCEKPDGGFLINETTSEYSTCPADHYCPDYIKPRPCPEGKKSRAGSSVVDDCKQRKYFHLFDLLLY